MRESHICLPAPRRNSCWAEWSAGTELLRAFVLLTPLGSTASTGQWLFQFGVCRETTMLQRSALILASVLVAGSASASIAAGAKHSEHEKSYRRAPMWARSMAPRIESGAAATQKVKTFTIEE